MARDKDASSASSAEDSDEFVDSTSNEFTGPWLLNSRTGWYHRTVRPDSEELAKEGYWCLACRPGTMVPDWYKLRKIDSGLYKWFPAVWALGMLSQVKVYIPRVYASQMWLLQIVFSSSPVMGMFSCSLVFRMFSSPVVGMLLA